MANEWYRSLERPPLTPPDWLFGPVWTVLYVMIVTAIVLYVRAPEKEQAGVVYAVLAVHVATNAAWTWLFFGRQAPFLALLDIVLLVATLVWLIGRFAPASKVAAGLLIPYLAWVSFATYLNVGFWWLNRG